MGLRELPGEQAEERRNRKKRKKWLLLLCAVLLLAGAVFEGYRLFGPNRTHADLRGYFGIQEDSQWAVLLNQSGTGQMAVEIDGALYLPLSYVQETLDSRYYTDSSLGALLYVLPDRLITVHAGDSFYLEGEERVEFGEKVLVDQGDTPYLSLRFFETFSDYNVKQVEEYHVLWLWNRFEEELPCAQFAGKKGVLRTRATKRSPILAELTEQEMLFVIAKEEGWTCVMTQSGLIGYVPEKELGEGTVICVEREKEPILYPSVSREDRICLVWHQMDIYNYENQAGRLAELLEGADSVNVVSPTWYSLSSAGGDFNSLSSAEYVKQAHDLGVQVWALIDNFNSDVDNLAFLSSFEARQHLIAGLMQEAANCGFDGINVDFEAQASGMGGLNKECGPHFLEFLRELSVACRKAGLVLSVDNYVPASYNQYYNRAEQGRIVDYVIVMGYDEHYAGSEETGSVASYPFVKSGIEDTVAQVPASKVINAIPFYTRVWSVIQEEDRQVVVSSEAMGMDAVRALIEEKQIQLVWQDSVRQFYGEYQMEGLTGQLWVEDAQSVSWKLELIRENRLAGVACWKLGLESDEVWDVMREALGN